jgi:hypothetical protein
LLRILIKVYIIRKLESNQTYLPGKRPFNFLIYTKRENSEEIVYRLDLNHLKNGLENIFNINIKKNSIELRFLIEALKIAKKYRFFSKWQAMIPLIKIKGDLISILMLLGEPYFKNRAYFVKTTFDMKTGSLYS